MEGPRTAVGLLERGPRVPSPPDMRSGPWGAMQALPAGSGAKLGFLNMLGSQKITSEQNRTVCQIMFFFDTAPVSQYVINEGTDNKLNSMDSILVDVENVVIM